MDDVRHNNLVVMKCMKDRVETEQYFCALGLFSELYNKWYNIWYANTFPYKVGLN